MSKKVLLIDEDDFVLRAFSFALKQNGLDVYTAKGGTEGVKKIEELQPDLIFLELMISFPNGFDILEQFKNKVIVVVSQLTQESDKERALGLGAKEYIAKEGLPTRAIVQTAFNFLNK